MDSRISRINAIPEVFWAIDLVFGGNYCLPRFKYTYGRFERKTFSD